MFYLRSKVRTFNLRHVSTMRDLEAKDIDHMCAIRGMVVRISPVIPDLKQAFFRCSVCHYETEVMIDRGNIQEPSLCAQCEAKQSLQLIHNRCVFSDKQMIKLQEAPEAIPQVHIMVVVSLSFSFFFLPVCFSFSLSRFLSLSLILSLILSLSLSFSLPVPSSHPRVPK